MALTKRRELEQEMTEMKMPRFSVNATRLDKTRNDHITEKTQVGRLGDKMREFIPRWFGQVR